MLTKDEINSSFYVAFCVDLVADLSKEGILVSVKTDTIVTLLCVVSSKSNGLGPLSVRIPDVYVVELGVLGEIDDRPSVLVIRSTTEKT